MIEFNVDSIQKDIKCIPKKYPKLTEYEVDFSIIINGQLFFDEPNFPVLEFLHFVNIWKDKGNHSFEYISIETEENPLISFICKNDMFLISSPWQLFECKTEFTKEQLICALDNLENEVKV